MNALEVNGLCKHRDGFELSNITFTLPKGFILGYVGQNGAGKTTTIQSILHLVKPDGGTIRVNGHTYEEDPVRFLSMIGYIADECYLPENFTAIQVEKMMKKFYADFDQNKYQNYLSMWNLPRDRKILDYSKGMQVRLMFACVLSRDTKVIILDEATSGLDPVIRTEILELLQQYIADGEHSVLLSTHIMGDLEQVADYVCFINDGKRVFFDEVNNILENYVVVKGATSMLTPQLEKLLVGAKVTRTGFEGLLSTDSLNQCRKDFMIEKPNIEQIIVQYIHGIRRKDV